MPHHHEERAIPAIIQLIVAVHLLAIHNRHKEIGREKDQSPAKLRRGYADDRERMFVDLNHSAQYAAIILEMGVPIRIAEHDVRSAVETVLIRGVKKTAEIRMNPQCVKVVPARLHTPGRGWPFAGIERDLRDAVSNQTIKAAVAVAQILIIRIGVACVLAGCALDSVEGLRIGHIQWPQNQPIHNAEYHGVRADSHRQRANGGNGEARGLAQLPQHVAKILSQPTHSLESLPFKTTTTKRNSTTIYGGL